MAMGLIKKNLKYILFIFLVLLIVVNLFYLFVPFERDEGTYAYIGWLWLSGKGLPYVSAFDPKTPLTYLLYGLGYFLTPGSFMGARIIALLYKTIILFIFFKIIKKVSNNTIGLCITVATGWFMSSLSLEGQDFNTDIQTVLPLLILIYIFFSTIKKAKINPILLFIAGVSAGLAIFIKSPAIFPVSFLLVWYILSQKKISSFIYIFLGILMPFVIFLAYGYKTHLLSSFYKDVVVYNRIYVSEGFRDVNIFSRAYGTSGILGYIIWLRLIPPLLEPLVVISVASILFSSNKRNAYWYLAAGLMITFYIGAKSGGSRDFPHYYLPLVFGLGFAQVPLIEILYKVRLKNLIYFIFTALVFSILIIELPVVLSGPLAIQRFSFGSQGDWFVDAVTLGEWMNHNTSPNNTLLSWTNEPEIYYYSQKFSLTKYVNFYGFWYFPNEEKVWLSTITRKQPMYIVTYTNDPSSYSSLQEFLNKNNRYQKFKTIGTYFIFKRV